MGPRATAGHDHLDQEVQRSHGAWAIGFAVWVLDLLGDGRRIIGSFIRVVMVLESRLQP